jgi:glycosyltransferase involved in cell wall biosynthesis
MFVYRILGSRVASSRKRPPGSSAAFGTAVMPVAGVGQPTSRPRVVVSVNARASDDMLHGGGGSTQRRTDFATLTAALDADTVDWDTADRKPIWRMLRRRLGFGPVAAALILLRRRRYDVVWCFSEIEGLLLALLFKIFRVRRILFVIADQTLYPKPVFLLKRLRVWTHFTVLLPRNCHQAAELHRVAGVPEDKMIVLPYQVDCDFFSGRQEPGPEAEQPYILTLGLGRDYPALLKATDGLDVEVRIAGTSLWGKAKPDLPATLPPNAVVINRFFSYDELRQMYAGAALVVVPLHETPYQHGITAVAEAMAMGLPIIVTRTAGMGDVIIDRRKVLRSNPALGTQGAFAQMLAPGRPDLQQSNGFYVGVGDVEALRRSILYLLQERDFAASLGAQAQRFAREILSVDAYTERAVRLVTAAWRGDAIRQQLISDLGSANRADHRVGGQPPGSRLSSRPLPDGPEQE